MLEFSVEPADNKCLAYLCGQFDEHLQQVEKALGVVVNHRGSAFKIEGDQAAAELATKVIKKLYSESKKGPISGAQVHMCILHSGNSNMTADKQDGSPREMVLRTSRRLVTVRSDSQQAYVNSIRSHDISFAIGPAGTGKTYLAVACAVEALERDEIKKLILVRPAVEAGERLGFLPGDLAQKIDPYLRPLYDALYIMLGYEKVSKLIENNVIEIAPLAYMRGRTLSNAFVILDEAQNTTAEQMKMFLTRIGFGSLAVITGDITQVDLPRGTKSGLRHAMEVLEGIKGIGFNFFHAKDVVRHPLVQKIVTAYANKEEQ
ncbi:Phosphate starvation-inducible protein PhoH, predicted ATPase [hydrothermal vent metagenome]|uniref:PhoH-like protein n=1 Tax=hydrothermal vent metagenome TaxID=652676 RepID=A0A3B0ZXH1_9ZZZZ